MRKNVPFVIIVLAALKFGLPFLLPNPTFELHRDEYLYYAQGQHLAFGFLENPPLLSLLGAISAALGGAPFLVTFWPALFGALLLLVTAKLVAEFGGGLFAQIIAALGILFSAFLRTNYLFQPNFLEHFFWTLAVFYLVRYSNTPQSKYLYLLSLAVALGWWSKYSVLFFVAALFIALILSPQRIAFTKKHFWFAVALGIVLILPNIIWQWQHNWPLAHHMAELRDAQLQYVSKLDFLKEQLLLLFPVAFVWIGGLVWLLRQPHFRVVAFIYLGIAALLLLGSGKGYYLLGAYPMLLAGGGVWLERLSDRLPWLRYASVAVVLVLAMPLAPLLLPMQAPAQMAESNKKWGLEKLGLLKWEDRQNHLLQQDFADMLGWQELTQKAENAYNDLPTFSKAHAVILCDSYGQAGALHYFAKAPDFKSKIISTNGSFLLWINQPVAVSNLIYVGEKVPDTSDVFFSHFGKRTILDSVTNMYSRQLGNAIILYQNPDSRIGAMFNNKLSSLKAQFSRH